MHNRLQNVLFNNCQNLPIDRVIDRLYQHFLYYARIEEHPDVLQRHLDRLRAQMQQQQPHTTRLAHLLDVSSMDLSAQQCTSVGLGDFEGNIR